MQRQILEEVMQQFTTVTTQKCSKLLQWKMKESTYNVSTHYSSLYALKVWKFLNSIQKAKFFCSSYFLLRSNV